MRRYNPKVIEPKWQKIWDETGIYKTEESKSKPKKYILEYFPYPSGATMHVGHVRNYSIGDTVARYSRMKGFSVLHPMGWDAFGLPAENFAIKNNISPKISTEKNVETFKNQLKQLGYSYDWLREINSSDPDYYKWTQWLFLKFYEKSLAYRAKSFQNWCPTDQTVLANEQVITKEGVNVCERDGTPVVQKEVEQWFLKITEYADRLVDDLNDLDWPEGIKAMQRNWIGRSKGTEIIFETEKGEKIKIFTTRPDTIFGTTYLVLAPEHPLVEKIISEDKKHEVQKYMEATANKSELDRLETQKEKTGVFTGAYAINPANKEEIPIWIADYVLMSYGTGAIMGVPAHDERDHDFAKKYELPIKTVILEDFGEALPNEEYAEGVNVVPYNPKTGLYLALDKWANGVGLVSGGLNKGESFRECASRELAEETGLRQVEELITLGEPVFSHYFNNLKKVNKRAFGQGFLAIIENLKEEKAAKESHETFESKWMTMDEIREGIIKLLPSKGAGGVDHWLEMCDRAERAVAEYKQGRIYQTDPYEGEGIVINSGRYNDLTSAEAREKIVSDLAERGIAKEKTQFRLRDWSVSRQRYWGCPIPIIYCEMDGIVPVPEEDLPVVLPDSVEFKPTGQSPLKDSPEFVNVKCPKCGEPAKRETDTFDTFIDSSWYFLRFTDPHNKDEPFSKDKSDYWMPIDSYIGGAEHAVVHLLYARFWTKFLKDTSLVSINEPFNTLRNHGMIGGADGRKMGKRYGNVVTPDELIEQGYGADSVRLYELFIGPYNMGVDWNPRGIAGTYRFLDRLWVLAGEFLESESSTKSHNSDLDVQIKRIANKTVKKVSQDLEELGFNTAISSLMGCVNELYKIKSKHNFGLAHQSWRDALILLTQMLAPLAPHISEELWSELGQSGSVHVSKWPSWDESLIVEDIMTLAVQINGKVRAEIIVPVDDTEKSIIEIAKSDERVAAYLKGKKIQKEIYVSGRLVSLVVDS